MFWKHKGFIPILFLAISSLPFISERAFADRDQGIVVDFTATRGRVQIPAGAPAKVSGNGSDNASTGKTFSFSVDTRTGGVAQKSEPIRTLKKKSSTGNSRVLPKALDTAPSKASSSPQSLMTPTILPIFSKVQSKSPESSEKLIAGITELIPQSNIFVTSRHVIQHSSLEDLQRAFSRSKNHLNFDDYKDTVIQFKENGNYLDVVLLVPKKRLDAEKSVQAFLAKLFAHSKDLSATDPATIGDDYRSYQLGILSGPVIQESKGQVTRISLDERRFFLDFGGKNRSTLGSSGALVLTRSMGGDGLFHISGVVECIIEPKSDLNIEGAIQVIPFAQVRNADAEQVSFDAILASPMSLPEECDRWSDARDGGG